MEEKELIVEIPKKYKRNLGARFNYKNKKRSGYDNWRIPRICPLCKNSGLKKETCEGCPFDKFRISTSKEEIVGCYVWINKIIPHKHFWVFFREIYWEDKNDKLVENELRELREKAKELIKWV